jgi:hypothetical protein
VRLFTRGWREDLLALAAAAKTDVLVVCPFIGGAAEDVFSQPLKNGVRCRLITRLDKHDLWKRVSRGQVLVDLTTRRKLVSNLFRDR